MNIAQKIYITTIFMLCRCSYADTDYAQSTNPTAVKPLPDSSISQVQNPPTFSWSQFPDAPTSYVLEIHSGKTLVASYTSPRNWVLPSQTLKNGTYTWRVRPSTSMSWSKQRSFIISTASQPFVVPDNAQLRATILARKRPRSLADSFLPVAKWTAAMQADRQGPLLKLEHEVDTLTKTLASANDSNWPIPDTSKNLNPEKVAQINTIRHIIFAWERQINAAGLLYALTGEKRFFDEAVQRADQLAALNPAGPTSQANQDQANRSIALALAQAIDFLGADLDSNRRSIWLKNVALRTDQIYQDLAQKNNRLDQYPFDSHGGTNLGYLALISTMALGDLPQATAWFDYAFRDYASWIMAWSGPEGGFANGTSYGQYSASIAVKLWDPLYHATRVNLFSKPWSRGFLTYLMQFVPPGSQSHVFGDEHELAPDFNALNAYAARFATPEAAWYVQALALPEDPETLLLADYPLPSATASNAKAPANTSKYDSIGWVAMHSDLADPQRTSLYFKSSPFGSFSHSHGDQNSFTLSKGGVPLLIETGWDDWYGSPLSASWYRQTKAHNAITFDGGTGQLISGYEETMANNGKLSGFSTDTDVDYVAGDALKAYGSALTQATRKIWYLRHANAFVIEDLLVAAQPHIFEWNLHAAAPFVYAPDGSISITNQGQSVCVSAINKDGVRFEKKPGAKAGPGKFEDHAALVTTNPVVEKKFLVLLDVGCLKPSVTLTTKAQKATLIVAGQSITLDD